MKKSKLRKVSFIRNAYENFKKSLTVISPTLSTKVGYRISKGKKINLKDPKTLDEKISWLKLNVYNKDPKVALCADKYKVREYVAECGCEEILNDLLFVYDHEKEINWDELPSSFVLKWNFGCHCNVIVDNKEALDIKKTMKDLKKWRKTKYHLLSAEMQYKYIPHKLVCEKYLKGKDGLLPEDYKVYCFNGVAKYVMVCIGRELGHPKFYFFDRNWQMQKLTRDSLNNPIDVPKPENIDEVFEYAEKLSKGFPFVRADFYLIDGKTYFGELTFTPAGGCDSGALESADKYFGSLLDIEGLLKEKREK